MTENDDFYVGYQEEAPERQAQFIKRKVGVIFVVLISVALLFSLGQAPFKNSTFELGNLRELSGTFYHAPYPMLRVKIKNTYKDILLVGFGKFGVDQSFQNSGIINLLPKDGSELILKGTMIYYDGKALFQTEANLEGTYEVSDWKEYVLESKSLGVQSLKGEVVDPKCYFGVMKPGNGKIHRSCATRCLSGGIAPVFITTNQKGYHEYYILTDIDGKKLGREILEYVGKPSMLEGEVWDLGEWKQMRIDPAEILLLDAESVIYE